MSRATFTFAVAFLYGTAAALASDPKPDEVSGQGSPLSAAALRGWIRPDELTAEERALLDKDAIMQMYHPDEHSRHFVAKYQRQAMIKMRRRCFASYLAWRMRNLPEKRARAWLKLSIADSRRRNFFI